MGNIEGIGCGVAILMLGLIVVLIIIICRPWRFLSSIPLRTVKPRWDGDLDRPLVSGESDANDNESTRNYDVEGACYQNEGLLRIPRQHGVECKQRLPSASPYMVQGNSLFVDAGSDHAEDISVGQTLKRPLAPEFFTEAGYLRQEIESPYSRSGPESDPTSVFDPNVLADQSSCLSLEVVSGPSRGLRCSVNSTSHTKLPLTLGRVSSDLLVKDSEVSGRHAMVNWNADKMKWELVDMGSLNGTLLNSMPVGHPDSGSRHWGAPVELSTGDIVTLGTTSNVHVHVTSEPERQTPFGVGVASDPMALRRGGKKLPMEDVCYYQWPLPGIDQFGIFGICDGHGGVAAANSASKMLPQKVADILSDSLIAQTVILKHDASEVLRAAFAQTEASMNNYYEGCTATLLLVWTDGKQNLFAQCANVGDSACIMNVDGKLIKMTEDHRITSSSERLRISELGEPLRDGETRLCGLNLARMLGDKFLKQQDARFSSEPFVSPAVHFHQGNSAFALMASDGFWDVVGFKKAVQLVSQAKERYSTEGADAADRVANYLLSEARTQRTKDNTSIVFLDLDGESRSTSSRVDS